MSRRTRNKMPSKKRTPIPDIDKDRLSFTLERRITRELGVGASVRFAEELDMMSADLVVSTQVFLDYHMLDECTVRYPANWWEHFRDACFPKWLLKRWPVRYTETKMIAGLYNDRVSKWIDKRGYRARVVVIGKGEGDA